jgi:hypothetical protein
MLGGGARCTQITGGQGSFCLDVKDNSTSNGAEVHMWTCFSNVLNQQWEFIPASNGYFQIKSRASGKCLGVVGSMTSRDGTRTEMQVGGACDC